MTRRKSKMLALAVMGAILMGGYSGVNPVCATDQNFDGNIKATGTITAANNKFLVKADGTLQVEDELTISHANGDDSGNAASLNIDRLSKLNQLVEYSSGDKTVITAGNGSTIGGVGFNAGALTGVTGINADDEYAKFRVVPVVEDNNGEKHYIFRAGNLEIATDINGEGSLYKDITFTDTNSRSNTVTLVEMMEAAKATKGIQHYTENDRFGTPRPVTAIESQVKIRDDGRIEINTTGSNSEQSVVIDSGAGILVGHQDQVKKLLDQDSSVTAEQKKAYLNKTAGISYDGVFAGGIKFDEAKAGMSNVDGSLKAASGKFTVNANGAISAADNKFEVTETGELKLDDKLTIQRKNFGGYVTKSVSLDIDSLGKLNQLVDYSTGDKTVITAGDGSTIGGVTISNGRLSVPMGTNTVGVNVSDLAEDHDIITNDRQYTYSSTTIKSKIDSLEQSSGTLGSQIQKIERFTKLDTGKEGTSIAGNLDVYDDGTVIINEGKDLKVTIDRDRLSIGNVSLIENDYVEANGTIHYNDTINDHAKLDVKKGKIGYKVGNYSVTTSSATATGDYDVDQANKGTVFSNDTNYTRIDGAQVNSVNGGNTGILDGASLELKSQHGNIKLINDQGTFTDANGNYTEISGARITTSTITAKEGVNAKTISIGEHAGDLSQLEFFVAENGNVYTKGGLSALGGKFLVYEDGALKAADGAFNVDKDGKLISASGSKIGDVTINGESLSYDRKSITVSELASDHALVNDATKGNENLYTLIGQAQGNAQDLDDRTKGISRDATNAVTTIEGKLKVGSDGTVTINEGDAQQVIIDNTGINVGLGSVYINSDGFKVGTDGKNSLTSSGLNAKTLHAGTNNTEFTVDESGNVVAKGTLSAADGKFSVAADGTVKAKKLITDDLVITGSGAAGGITGGSIAFGGSGTIKSNIKEGSRETTFETTVDGVNTKVTDGTKTTTVATTASGTTFTNETGTDTKINGSSLISSKSSTNTGTLDGSDLTLTNGENQTELSAGGATFTKGNETTTIDGGNISASGTLSVAGGNFTIATDGSFSAAGGNFKIDGTGTMTAGTMKMDKIEASDATKGIDVGGVNLKDKSITAADGKFKVDTDGKVIINEGTKNQVRIDSNGIKVGNNSAFISDDGFKSSGDLYIGTKTAPTEAATDARFYVKGSDGSVSAADGKFKVGADGGFTAADGKFKVDKDGNLEVKGTSVDLSEIADMSQDVARMNNRISDVSDRVNKVGAMSAAIASLKTIGYDPEAPTEFSVGLGQYKSETGLALGIFHYPNRNVMFNLSLSTSGGETMGGIGATWRIGHGASQKQMEVTVKDDVEKVIVKKEDYEALQAQVNQLAQVVQQLVAEKEARNS